MYRRDFLKLSGLLSVALLVQFNRLGKAVSLPLEVESRGRSYSGTSDGKIYVSENGGRAWRLHTGFGPQYAIRKLSTDSQERVVALIEYLGYDFKLVLSSHDGPWKTI